MVMLFRKPASRGLKADSAANASRHGAAAGTALLFRWLLVLSTALPVAAQPGGTPGAPREAAGGSGSNVAQKHVAALPPAGYRETGGRPLLVTGAVSRNAHSPDMAALGDTLIVQVQGLADLLDPVSQVRCSDLILFLDGIAIPGSPPESCSPGEGKVRFHLDRTDESDSAWHTLLAEPSSFTRTITVTIGSAAELAYPTNVQDFKLEVLPHTELFCFFGILAIGIGSFGYIARKTSILRASGPVLEGSQAPFSLPLCQMAFWSILVIAAYIFIWMVTEELDTITGSVLLLLGISSGTALGAVLIDSGSPSTGTTPVTAGAMAPTRPPYSQGFLKDLLADDHGISVYRFQLVAWTLVLGVIFCVSVYDGLQMPQFSTTLLGLMGLSSGTYLGFKLPQGTKSEQYPSQE